MKKIIYACLSGIQSLLVFLWLYFIGRGLLVVVFCLVEYFFVGDITIQLTLFFFTVWYFFDVICQMLAPETKGDLGGLFLFLNSAKLTSSEGEYYHLLIWRGEKIFIWGDSCTEKTFAMVGFFWDMVGWRWSIIEKIFNAEPFDENTHARLMKNDRRRIIGDLVH